MDVRLTAAVVGGAVGNVALVLVGNAAWHDAPASAIVGCAIAAWLIGAALAVVIAFTGSAS